MTLNILQSASANCPSDAGGYLYDLFVRYVHNPLQIRLGLNEKIVTKRLALSFESFSGYTVSSTVALPRLMKRLMTDFPQHGITRRLRNTGVVYLGIGLASDPLPNSTKPPRTSEEITKERKLKEKEYSAQRARNAENWAHTLRDEICTRTQWTPMQYEQARRLKFIVLYHHGEIYDIEATIISAKHYILQYIYDKLNDLNTAMKSALSLKEAFERASAYDEELSAENKFPIYTNRNKVSPYTYGEACALEMKLQDYQNAVACLPRLDHIMYPDMEPYESMVTWLKDHSESKTRRDMARTQEAANPDPPEMATPLTYVDIVDMTTETHILTDIAQ